MLRIFTNALSFFLAGFYNTLAVLWIPIRPSILFQQMYGSRRTVPPTYNTGHDIGDVNIKIRVIRKWSENFPRACRDLSFAKAVVPTAKKGHRQGQRKSATEGGKVGEPPYES